MVTILEAATMARVSKDKARYWFKLLELETIKKDGKLFFPDNAVDLLNAMKNAIEAGLAPVAAAVEVKSIHPCPAIKQPPHDSNQSDIVLDKITELQNAIMLLAGTVEKQNKLIEAQAIQINLLTTRLPAPKLPQCVNVWQPKPRQVVKVPFWRHIWLELFNPVMLRAEP